MAGLKFDPGICLRHGAREEYLGRSIAAAARARLHVRDRHST
jgi:hypothetical protein